MNWNQALFPSLKRRGGCAIKKMSRSNLSSRRRGGAKRKPDRAQPQEKIGEIFRPEEFRRTDHPVCGASEASRLFINAAATPPFQGGECVRTETVCQLIHFLCKAPHSARIAFDESHQMVRACCQCIRTDRTRSASASTELLPDCWRGRKHWCSGGRRWCRRCRFGFGSKR